MDQDPSEYSLKERSSDTPRLFQATVVRHINDSDYWRPFRNSQDPSKQKYGLPRRNPWHENLDPLMFYL